MDFYEVVRQAANLLQQQGRVTYRGLKLHFKLDDDTLEALKDELLFSHPVAEDGGRGLVRISAPGALEHHVHRGTDADVRFYALLRAAIGLLRGERRLTYRELKHVFGLDDGLLQEIREELIFKRLAIDEDGKGLVWTHEAQPVAQPVAVTTGLPLPAQTTVLPAPAAPTLPTPATEVETRPNGPGVPPEFTAIDAPQDEPVVQASARTVPEAERRQLTVMFCDLADSTKLSQQLDPEDLREVVRTYQATAAEVIQPYAGHMAQYLGDGLLIYFGWPQAHEDDVQRSLHAGLGIVEAITTTLNPCLEAEKGVQLTVRIGIHTGPVVVGEMGGGSRHENLATGETVNIAARLEGLASANTVVISQVTARLVGGTFALENLGHHALKGVAEPMQVLRVLGPMERHDDETVVAGVPFLVGRDEEMGLLFRRWEQSKEGLGQVVLVSGTAGIGKSSLLEGLRARVRNEGVPCITMRCSSYHTNSALYPVITHVERMLDLQREDAPATKLDKLEQGLRPYSQPLEEVVPLFAGLLSIPLEARYPALTLTPQQQKQHTLDALVAWMLEEGERQPVLVAWEDLHWADPSTLELLGLLLEQTPTVPMLHVLTYRPEFALPWPARSHMTPLTLNRLERPQVEALITHMADGKALPTEVVEHIVSKTDGVPLYVEELTKMLLSSELLKEEVDQYMLTGPLSTVAIPDTLQDSLMARLDQMNTAKEVAQLGAVIGREFAYEVIQAISSQDEEALQAGLSQLVEAELLYQRGRLPRTRYIFKHALIQDAAYASLLRSQRQAVHQQIAQTLEEQFPETVEMQPELVAHHYTEGGLSEQAVGYWHRAGQKAVERSAHVEASHHLNKGLELLRGFPETGERHKQELALLIALGNALIAAKGHAAPEVGSLYSQARQLCQQVGETPLLFPTLYGLWVFNTVRANHRTAYELGEELLRLAQPHDESGRLTAHRALGWTLLLQGDLLTSQEHFEQLVTLYDPAKHRSLAILYGQDHGTVGLSYGSLVLWLRGYPDQALQRSREAVTLAQDLSHPLSLAYALCFAAIFHQMRRETQATLERAEAVITLSADFDIRLWGAWGAVPKGWTLVEQREIEAGIDRISWGMDTAQTLGAELLRPYFLGLLAETYGKTGKLQEGCIVIAEALGLVDKNDERWYEAELHRLKGQLLLQQSPDNAAEAETSFQKALSVAQFQQAKSWELRAATSLARLWQSQDKRQEAYDLLAPVYAWFTEGFDTADLTDAQALLATLQ